jgi:ubiquinone/menaquinone biosynthesis C-methylase UbiE
MAEVSKPLTHGDFTGLAENYSKYRPNYAPSVLDGILGIVGKPVSQLDFADVGAGTGIWTRMVAARGVRSATAVEPNDDMRDQGCRHSDNGIICWRSGSGEATGLSSTSIDLLSMASSFHWVDFHKGIEEFIRVLRPGGCFVALWNPRLIEVNPVLVDIENQLNTLKNGIKRVSSGRSGITDTLAVQLETTRKFESVTYLESRHSIAQSPEHYLGVWRSVNDLQVQLGAQKFAEFLAWVEKRIAGMTVIEATYLTRAWVARRPASLG